MTKVTWKATLFDKAIGDIYIAKSCVNIRPDYSLYHTQQAVEKMIKGAMNCYELETYAFMGDHDIIAPLDELLKKVEISEETQHLCEKFENVSPSIRYSSMKSDPTKETAQQYINDAEKIIAEISKLPQVERYYKEALEVNQKVLREQSKIEVDFK
jgi:HEPN domain-containing protein